MSLQALTPSVDPTATPAATPAAIPVDPAATLVVAPPTTTTPAAPVVTQATLRADFDRLVAEVRANFTKEKQLIRIATQEKRTTLELDNKIQKLNETAQLQAGFVSNLSPEY